MDQGRYQTLEQKSFGALKSFSTFLTGKGRRCPQMMQSIKHLIYFFNRTRLYTFNLTKRTPSVLVLLVDVLI